MDLRPFLFWWPATVSLMVFCFANFKSATTYFIQNSCIPKENLNSSWSYWSRSETFKFNIERIQFFCTIWTVAITSVFRSFQNSFTTLNSFSNFYGTACTLIRCGASPNRSQKQEVKLKRRAATERNPVRRVMVFCKTEIETTPGSINGETTSLSTETPNITAHCEVLFY